MKRREFLKLSAGMLVVCAGAGLGPLLRRNRRIYRKTTPLMGTIGDIQVVHDDRAQAFRAIDHAFDELIALEKKLSFFRADSEIGRINANAFAAPVRISRETGLLLEKALKWSYVTNGSFEPGLGKVSTIWDVKNRKEPPSEDLWHRFAGKGFYKKIVVSLSSEDAHVRFLTDDIKVDLGGIAKGYAADRVLQILAADGIEEALVNLGGDVAALGAKGSEGWRVGIRDPHRPSDIAKVLSLRNQAVATSGTYEQYFISQGHVYHHLIDPQLARPGVDRFESLTILTDSCCDADAMATGLFFMPDDDIRRTLQHHTQRSDWVRLGA